jgi:SdrD B-like domain/Secretion system C-terminal sorting domain
MKKTHFTHTNNSSKMWYDSKCKAVPTRNWLHFLLLPFFLALFSITEGKANNEKPVGTSIDCNNPVGCTPQGWMYLGTYNNNVYYKWIGGGDQSYAAAKAKVAEIGGCLPVPTSVAQSNFLATTIGGTAWLGLEKDATGWHTAGGSVLVATNWSPGEPNNAGSVEDRAMLHNNGLWNDIIGTAAAWTVAEVKCSGGPVSCNAGSTPNGWMYLGTYGGDYYFKNLTGDLTYDAAKAKAATIGGTLPIITSAGQNDFLKPFVTAGNGAWSGMIRNGATWNYTYTNWSPGQPDNAGGAENIMGLYPNGTWNDFPANYPLWTIAVVKCSTGSSTVGFGGQYGGQFFSNCTGPADPPVILTTAATCVSGTTPSYQWQIKTETNMTWTNIAGANGKDYDPGYSQVGSYWLRRLAFCDQSNNGVSAITSTNGAEAFDIHIKDRNTLGGTVSPAIQTICSSTDKVPNIPTLTGYNGSILRWEFATPTSGWNNWNGGGSATAPGNCCFNTVGTWKVRAIVKNDICGEVASSEALIKVVDENPTGYIDNNCTVVGGWTYDPSNPGASIDVHVYVRDPATNAVLGVHPVTANQPRPDINNLGIPGNHGYNFNLLPLYCGRNVKIEVYAINIGCGTTNPALGNSGGTCNMPGVPDQEQYISVDNATFVNTNTVTICSGQSILLDFNGPYTDKINFSFKRPDGAVFPGGTNGVATDQLLIPNVYDGTANEGTWVVTYTLNGCSRTENFVINVNPVPVITSYSSVNGSAWAVERTISLCQGGSFNLHPHPNVTPGWTGSGPAGFTSGQRNNDFANAQPNQSGVYTFTHKDANGCSATTTYNVTINPVPVPVCEANINNQGWKVINDCKVTICKGTPLMLSVNPNVNTVNWSGPNGFSQNNTNDANLGTTAVTGDYVYTITDNGCSVTKSIWVTVVDEIPTGYIDNACNVVTGWTYDPSNPGASIDVHVYVRDPTTNAVLGVYPVTANQPRPDINNLGVPGNHGYSFSLLPLYCGKNVKIEVYAINIGCGSTNPALGNSGAICNMPGVVITPYSSVNGSTWAVERNITLCQGGTFNLHPHPLTTTGWTGSGPAGFTSAQRNNDFANAQPNQSGVYTFTHKDANGCSATTTYNVTVNPNAVGGTLTAQAVEVCASQSNFPAGFLTLAGHSGTIVRWEWTVNGTWNDWGGAGSTNSPAGWIDYPTKFQVRVLIKSDNCGEVYSAVKDVYVKKSVGGTVSPASQTICNSTDKVPTIPTLAGYNGDILRWEFATPGGGWNNWNGGGSTTAPGNCCFNTVGTWKVRAIVKHGVCGEVASSEALIIVNPVPVITTQPTNQSICAGGSASFYVAATGASGVQWQFSGDNGVTWGNAGEAGNNTPTLLGVNNTTVQFRACVKSASGCNTFSNPVKVIVKTLDPGKYVGNYFASCDGPADPPIIQTTPATLSDGSIPTYQWQIMTPLTGWTNINGATSQNYDYPYAQIGSTWVRRLAFCSPTSVGVAATRPLDGHEAYDIHISDIKLNITASSTAYCAGNAPANVTLTANTTGYVPGADGVNDPFKYLWSNGATTKSITVTAPTATTTYTVTITSPWGLCTKTASSTVTVTPTVIAAITGNLNVCNGATTTLTASGGATYSWSNGITTATTTVGAGTYTVTVSNNGCTCVKTVTVNTTNISANVTGNLNVCNGANTTLTATGGTTYAWSNGANGASIDVSAGTYTVTVSNNGCSVTKTTTVNTTNIAANITGNLTVCAGTTTTLTATGGTTYTWSNGASGATVSVGAGTYTVTAYSNGCSATKTVIVVAIPTIIADVTGNLNICNGTTTTLTATGGTTYAWSNGTNLASVNVGAGTYTVTVTNNGCTCVKTVIVSSRNCNTASAGDYVFCDKNGNGIQDAGDSPIAGVTVILTGTSTTGQSITLTMVTGADGKYLFNNLPAGTYSVKFITPNGFVTTAADKGGNDATDSDANPTTGTTPTFTLTEGQSNLTLDAGYYQLSSLGDFVFCDKNKNGIQDAEDTGIPNVTVTLTGLLGDGTTVTLTTTTNASGAYNFSGLKPGTYTVKFTTPAGFAGISPKDAGTDDAKDSDIDATGSVTVTVGSGTTNTTIDAGFTPIPKASLGDTVFCDKNANGVQDAGEPGVAGVTVILTNTLTNLSLVATTDAFGKYLFSNLDPASYTVMFNLPFDYKFTSQDKGTNDAADSDANPITGKTGVYTLVAGENNSSVDAGVYKLASLGNFVFLDVNRDGKQDTNEPGVPNITVMLTGTTSDGTPVSLVTATDNNGIYKFINLQPGTYSVKFTLPTNYQFSAQDQGTDDSVDSDANIVSGVTASVTLAGGESNQTLDAGIYLKSSIPITVNIGNFVWKDCNKNGIQDAGEPGIPNITVQLRNASSAIITATTTNASGAYNFANVLSNTNYFITFIVPSASGLAFTVKDVNGNTSDNTDSDADISGNTALFNVAFTNIDNIDAGLQDVQAPVITGVPADVTVQCGQPLPLAPPSCSNSVGVSNCVKAVDNCDGVVVTTFSEIYYAGNCNGKSKIICSWTAKDACGNVSIKHWTITIAQNIAAKVADTANNEIVIPSTNEDIKVLAIEDNHNKELNSNLEIETFPNPSNGVFTVKFGNHSVEKIIVFNSSGESVYQENYRNNEAQTEIKLHNQKPGMYSIFLQTKKGIITKRIFIVD